MNKKYDFVEGDTLTLDDGTLLHRIRAVRDIPERDVKAGDLGGYIEKEGNLSHDDLSWVDSRSRVIGKDSTLRNSTLRNSTLLDSTVEHSTVRNSRVERSKVQDSVVEHSTVEYGRVEDSTIEYSVVETSEVDDSTVRSSMFRDSTVLESKVENSTIRDGKIINGRILDDQHHVVFMNVGSEKGRLTAYRAAAGIRVTRGCFSGTLEEFESAVNEKHGDNQYGQEYRILIKFIKKRASAWKKEGV